MSRTRKFGVFSLLTIAALIIAFAAVFAASPFDATPYRSAIAADGSHDSRDGTWFTGSGLQFGENIFSTSMHPDYSDSGDGSGTVSGSDIGHGEDFYVDTIDREGGKVDYSSTGLTVDGAKIASKAMMDHESPVNNAVYSAINDAQMEVYFSFEGIASYSATDGVTSNVSIKLFYYNSSTAGSPVYTAQRQISLTPSSGSSNFSVYFADSNNNTISISNASAGAYFKVEISSDYAATFRGLKAYVSVRMKEQFSFSNPVFTLSGANRTTLTYNVQHENYRREDEDGLIYVKTGDQIEFEIDVTYGSNLAYDFPSHYANVFRTAELASDGSGSCIVWEVSSVNGAPAAARQERDFMPGIVSDEIYAGTSASFKVASLPTSVTEFTITAYLYSAYERGEYTIRAESEPIVFKVDNIAPEIPAIVPESDFGKILNARSWYTESNNPIIELMSSATQSREFVYAFVMENPDIGTLDMTNYDYTPGVNAPLTYPVGGSSKTAERQVLYGYSKVKQTTINNGQIVDRLDNDDNPIYDIKDLISGCKFRDGMAQTLVLVRVDDAGNVSQRIMFTGNNAVKVDSVPREVRLTYIYGEEGAVGEGSMKNLATPYIFVGSKYHDENGVFIYKDNTDSNFATISTNPYASAKRLDYVTVRMTFSEIQRLNFNLVSYTNNATVNVEDIRYVTDVPQGRPWFFDFTFQMDEIVMDGYSEFYFNFREWLTVKLTESVPGLAGNQFEFDGREINAVTRARAYDSKGKLQQGIGYNPMYYKLYDFSYYPADNTVVWNGISYPGSGTPSLQKEYTFNGVQWMPVVIERFAQGEGEDQTSYYEIAAYRVGEGQPYGYKDAGTYWLVLNVDTTSTYLYCGTLETPIEILKASPAVTNLRPTGPLTYGTFTGVEGTESYQAGFDFLRFYSDSVNGELISPEDNVYFNGVTYYYSGAGVLGQYYFITPEQDSAEYYNPSVNAKRRVVVEFRPVDVTSVRQEDIANNYDFFYYLFYDFDESKGMYVLKEGAKHAGNYDRQQIEVYVEILHATATVQPDGEWSTVYDGTPQSVSVVTEPAGLPVVIEYKLAGTGDENYSVEAPHVAGEYIVRFGVDSENCNYTSERKEQRYVINRRNLDLEVGGLTPLDTALIYQGQTFTSSLDLLFGRLTKPQTTATDTVYDSLGAPSKQEVFVRYSYDFLQVADYEGQPVSGGVEYQDVLQITGNLLDAGYYLMTINVYEQNYSGSVTVLLRIGQAFFDNEYLSVVFPQLLEQVENYDLDEKLLPFRAHFEYGLTLAEAQELFLLMDANSKAQFIYAGISGMVDVPGRFFVESEDQYIERNGLDPADFPRNQRGALLLPVKYDADDNIIAYSLRLCWEAGAYENVTDAEGNITGTRFVKDYNFELAYTTVEIRVARAAVTFDNVKLSDLIYGQKLSEASVEGLPVDLGGTALDAGSYTVEILESGDLVYPKGSHNITARFLPGEAIKRSYRALIGIQIPLNVGIKTAYIEFTDKAEIPGAEGAVLSRVYRTVYADPQYRVYYMDGDNKVYVENILVSFAFADLDGNSVTMSNTTPVGQYVVTASINDENYAGVQTEAYYVVRADLTLYRQPGYGNVYYGTTLGEVELSAGSCMDQSGTDIIEGTFRFVDPAFRPEPGEHLVGVEFVPNDPDVYHNYNRFVIEDFLLIVLRAPVTITTEVTSFVYDGSVVDIGAEAFDPDGNPLQLIVNYSTEDGKAPVNAGTYVATIRVDETVQAYYAGELVVDVVIEKASASIDASAQTFVYTGEGISAELRSDPDGLAFRAVYRDNVGAVVEGLPFRVGRYNVELTVDDPNYKGFAALTMMIRPELIGLDHIDQNYQPDISAALPVVPSFNPAGIASTVSYRLSGSEADFSTSFPTRAGVYEIRIELSQNGYNGVFTTYEDGLPLLLTIHKIAATISADPVYTSGYRGEPIPVTSADSTVLGNTVSIAISPIGIGVRYFYKPEGADDSAYSETAPTDAGRYDVRIVIDDPNYYGTHELGYVIEQAVPFIRDLPYIESTIFYGDYSADVVFSEELRGVVLFRATGEDITELGHWEIGEEIRGYICGTHNVRLKFVPDDATNFTVAESTINVSIVKMDISDLLRVNEEDLLRPYSGQPAVVRGYIDPSFTPVAENDPIKLRVEYGQNFSVNAPSAVGEYNVRVVVVDDNYAGISESALLRIMKAIPDVVYPQYNPLKVGTAVKEAVLSVSGKAYVPETNRTISLEGTFEFAYPDYKIAHANENSIAVTFVPADSSNYQTVSANINLVGIGAELELNGVAAEELTFGMPLKQSQLTYVSATEKGTENVVEGTLLWVDETFVPGVGAACTYVFQAYDRNIYNDYYGTIEVEVAPGLLYLDLDKSVIRNYIYPEGQASQAVKDAVLELGFYYLTRYDQAGDLLPGDAVRRVYVDGVTYALNNDFGNLDDIVTEKLVRTVGIDITHPDFSGCYLQTPEGDVVCESVSIGTYYYVAEQNIIVGSREKYFDDEAVTVEDLGLQLSDTIYQVDFKGFRIVSVTSGGVAVDEIRAAGVYLVTVRVDDANYDGVKTFEYRVLKRDISDAMSIEGNQKVYGESGSPRAVFDGYEIASGDLIYQYFSEDFSQSYGSIVPQFAGVYKVRVTIAASNPSYTATKDFNYIITKKEATISVNSLYTYTYGEVSPIVPVISNNISKEYYKIYYTKDGASAATEIAPTDFGSYSVRIVITNHPNFEGEATTRLIINKASVVVDTLPTLDPIVYGLKLSTSRITGGKVVFGLSATEVKGVFSFLEPDRSDFNAGRTTVRMVFTPTNANFNAAEFDCPIEILQATASIEFTGGTTAIYNGAQQTPGYVTQPAGIDVVFTFYQDNVPKQAIAAGTYRAVATINNPNYVGSAEVEFTIQKASAIDVVNPNASSIRYGQALQNSTLTGGSVVYVAGAEPVVGTFDFYRNPGSPLGEVGVYDVEYRFTPRDTQNYEVYYGVVPVRVEKASAEITVSNTKFVYGQPVTAPVFTTDRGTLAIDNSEFDQKGMLGSLPNSGVYQFTATIEDKNYEGSVVYLIEVDRKEVSVRFVDDAANPVTRYLTHYGSASLLYAKAEILVDSLIAQDRPLLSELNGYLQFRYAKKGEPFTNATERVPTAVGEYVVYVLMRTHNNYFITEGAVSIDYIVERGTINVNDIVLSNLTQTYGSVAMPVVTVTPSGVEYVISFPGYLTMPTSVGTHSVKVTVTDPNYLPVEKDGAFRILPKEISVENLKVYDKAFDGTPNIKVTGNLKGVLPSDEVYLTLTAVTENKRSEAGKHNVILTSWDISGLHAGNYIVVEPIYSLNATILRKTVSDPVSGSYISSDSGFSANVTVEFDEVYDARNQTNFFTSLFGQKATVQKFSIKENGITTVLDGKVKFFVKIPDKYLNAENLAVEGLDELADQNIQFTREGDYIVFYADTSGSIVFYTNDFPYWIIIVVAVVLMLIIGTLCVVLLSPVQRRKRTSRRLRKAYEAEQKARSAAVAKQRNDRAAAAYRQSSGYWKGPSERKSKRR